MTDEGDLIAGRYRLVAKVGSGAMGVVWHARDTVLDRSVAIKELLVVAGMTEQETDEANRRALREGRIAARLHHPHAITVYDVLEHEGRPCLVMEYLPSRSLGDLLEAGEELTAARLARIGSHIAAALAAAHQAGIVHRDVKPANVLLAEDGRAKLTDFGISRAVGDTTVTATGILAGTPAYLSPEVAQGHEPSWRGDIYSLGATLYTAVEGAPPFGYDDNPMALLNRVASDEITPPTQAGPLTAALSSMLHRDAERRPSARTVAQLLAAIADGAEAAKSSDEPPVVIPAPLEPEPEPEPAATAPEATAAEPASVPAAAPAPTPVVPPTPGVAAERVVAAEPKQRNRRWLIPVALVAAVLLISGTLVIILRDHGNATAAGTGAGATSNPLTSSAAPVTTTTTTTSPPVTTHTSAQAPVIVPTTTQQPTTTPSTSTDLATQLVSTIVNYYNMMPGNTSEGWNWMTDDYRQNHAGGWTGYTQFWSQFQSVAASNVSATLPSTVTATITYHYKNGSTTTEVTSFGLVQQGGMWKIASSVVGR